MQIIHVQKNTKIDTLQKAIDMVFEPSKIIIHPGLYQEKVKITKNNITISGLDPQSTIITYNDYAKKIHQDKKEYNTFRTYTILILSNNVTLENLTIQNNSGEGHVVGQAVALATIGNNIYINNCLLKAHQDTLFIGPLPKDLIIRYQNFLPDDELIYPQNHHIFIQSTTIIGDVDFIFGAGSGYFKDCTIISLPKNGFVCAPATEADDNEGFVFNNCYFKKTSDNTKSYLARPWRDYGKATFINCIYDNHIVNEGFDKWNDTSRDKTARFYEGNCKYFDNHNFKRVYFLKSLTKEQITDIENLFTSK